MFEKVKQKLTHVSKETVKEEIKKHAPELLQGATIMLLLYLCVKAGNKSVNVTVNVNGGGYVI